MCTRALLEQANRETSPLGPTGHRLHKANLPRLGVRADLSKHKEAVKTGRQRNRLQTKEQEYCSEKELNEMEVSNLSDIEFRVILTMMFNSIKTYIETIKKDQSEINNAISEIKYTLRGIKSKFDKMKD